MVLGGVENELLDSSQGVEAGEDQQEYEAQHDHIEQFDARLRHLTEIKDTLLETEGGGH